MDFNPRSSYEERPAAAMTVPRPAISIHAPRMKSDVPQDYNS